MRLIDIELEVDHTIHTNTGMALGIFKWTSWAELMEWSGIQYNTWGVSTEMILSTVIANSKFNEEPCTCSYEDIIGCTNPDALNYDPNATTACEGCCEYPPYAETITYNEAVKGWVSFKSFLPEFAISSVNQYYTMKQGMLWKHHQETTPESRNTFYSELLGQDAFEESSITPVLNTNPDVIKNFNTLNYEGSQSKIDEFTTDPITGLTDGDYYNLYGKKGWYVEEIHTDKQDGTLNEFIEKEGKWFNYIKGSCRELDTAAFNFQGLGVTNLVTGECLPCTTAPVVGCTDSSAINYDANAVVDDGSCIYPVYGCTDPYATNYDANATVDDGSCGYVSGTFEIQIRKSTYPTTPDGAARIVYAGTNIEATGFTYVWSNGSTASEATGLGMGPIVYTLTDGTGATHTATAFVIAQTVYGCTNPSATNFNYSANTDDGTCTIIALGISGCTNPTATNYNPLATIDDGSCIGGPTPGCCDPTAANFDPLATCDDGSCL